MSFRTLRGLTSTSFRDLSRTTRPAIRCQTRRIHPAPPRRDISRSKKLAPKTHSFTQSGFGYTGAIVALGVGIAGVWILARQEAQSASSESNSSGAPTITDTLAGAPLLPGMPPSIPPGMPGNLTPEQTAKLREFWQLVLKVFGTTSAPQDVQHDASPSTAPSAPPSSPDPEKKKKHHLNPFKKHNHSSSSSPSPSLDDPSPSASDPDDKHNQTKDFKHALASQSPADLRSAFWAMLKHDDPDALLLRFLRARKWDPHAALVMLVATMHWRAAEMRVDADIMLRGEAGALQDSRAGQSGARKQQGEDFLAQMRMGKSYLHGVDAEGRPMCWVRVRLHRQGQQSEESLERYTVYTIETARMMLRGAVDTATIVFDMTDFSLANMDYPPVKFMIKVFEANYPESLGLVLVHRAPWLFQGIWKVIRAWLDPVVAAKVHFTNSVADLAAFVPRERIPVEVGGEEKWGWEYVEPGPSESEGGGLLGVGGEHRRRVEEEREELVRQWEERTVEWVRGGEEKGEERRRLAARLAENYWRLDPYVRARSVYDRIGVLREGGGTEFYPERERGRGAGAGAGTGPGVGVGVMTSADDVD